MSKIMPDRDVRDSSAVRPHRTPKTAPATALVLLLLLCVTALFVSAIEATSTADSGDSRHYSIQPASSSSSAVTAHVSEVAVSSDAVAVLDYSSPSGASPTVGGGSPIRRTVVQVPAAPPPSSAPTVVIVDPTDGSAGTLPAATATLAPSSESGATGNGSEPAPPTQYPQPIYYRDAATSDDYLASDTFDARGMQPVYLLANLLLDVVQIGNLPPGFFDSNTTVENILQVVINKKDELLIHFSGTIALCAFGLLLALLVPIVGFVFCICRCSGKCGARPSPYEKRYDACKRILSGIFLSLLVILVIFGIVCAFVTNQYMEEQIHQLPSNLNNSLYDVGLYQNNTKVEINSLLVDNFQQLEVTLDIILDRCGEIVKMHLADVSKALAVENLTHVVSGLEAVREDLNGIVKNTNSLQVLARRLENTLNASRQRLQDLLANCFDDICTKVVHTYKLDKLRVRPDFGRLPDVTQAAGEISRLIKDDIETEVRKGKESLDGISSHIQAAVGNTIPLIKQTVREVGLDLERNSQKICKNIDEEVELQEAHEALNAMNYYVDKYAIIRYYVCLAVCLVVLLITLPMCFGLFCGFCGRKPNYVYGDESCTKGTGARCIILAVFITFVFYFFLMVATTTLFLVGGIGTRVVCDPINDNPSTSEILKIADLYIAYNNADPRSKRYNFKLAETIERCHMNQSVYSVLNLESAVNIDAVTNYRQRFKVKEKVKQLADRISLSPSITILTPQAKSQLQQLADSKLSDINFTSYSNVLDHEILDTDLNEVMNGLKAAADLLRDTRPDMADRLETEGVYFAGMKMSILAPISQAMTKLKDNLHNLQRDIRFNRTSFREWVQDLTLQAEKAQNFIQNKGRTEVIELAHQLANNFTSYLDDYANRVNHQVKEEIGRCWPVSQALNASVVAVCRSILDPFNGFWASIGWCLTLFIPCLFLSVYLSKLYQKTDLHALPSTESHANKRHRKTQVTYDNQNGYIHDASPGFAAVGGGGRSVTPPPPSRSGGYYPANTFDYSSGTEGYELDDPHTFRNIPVKSSSPSSRAALQEWDFQSEAPPQYSSATNLTVPDFERPPPYYYPGPSPRE